jgi:hypothetical protein
MDIISVIILVAFLLVGGNFLFGRVKYGSWTGAFLKAHVEAVHGEIALSQGTGSQTMKVVTLREDGTGEVVGLVIVSRAALAAHESPFRLSKSQARELAGLLTSAAR